MAQSKDLVSMVMASDVLQCPANTPNKYLVYLFIFFEQMSKSFPTQKVEHMTMDMGSSSLFNCFIYLLVIKILAQSFSDYQLIN